MEIKLNWLNKQHDTLATAASYQKYTGVCFLESFQETHSSVIFT